MAQPATGNPRVAVSPHLIPASQIRDKIQSTISVPKEKIFSSNIDDFNVIDIRIESPRVVQRRCMSHNAVANVTSDTGGVRIRIINIPGLGTTSPLRISFEVVCQILSHYNVDPEFRDILFSFGRAPHSGEGGCSDLFMRSRTGQDRSYGYRIQYVEDNHREGSTWSHRQTGVYCRSSPAADGGEPFDLFILVHSSADSGFSNDVLSILHPTEISTMIHHRLCQDPAYINELALQSLLGNWRGYLEYWSSKYEQEDEKLFTIPNPQVEPKALSFEPVRHLRFIRREILTAKLYCSGISNIVGMLCRLPNPTEASFFDVTARYRLQGILTALEGLQSKIDNSLAMLEYALDLKNDARAADDSAAVRIITLVSLVFLPGSFICSIYGMNFFNFEDQGFAVSSKIWIWVVTWLPLTIATLIAYSYMNEQRKKAKVRLAGKDLAEEDLAEEDLAEEDLANTASALGHVGGHWRSKTGLMSQVQSFKLELWRQGFGRQ